MAAFARRSFTWACCAASASTPATCGAAPTYPSAKPPREDAAGYSPSFVRAHIAPIRTDLDRFTEAEQAVPVNHGYTVAGARLRRTLPWLVEGASPAQIPHPTWMPETPR